MNFYFLIITSFFAVPSIARAGGVSASERRLSCLQAMEDKAAQALSPDSENQIFVDAELQRRGIDPSSVAKLNDAFKIFPDFPEFGLRFGVNHHRFRQATLGQQIEEVAQFLAGYHLDMCGQATGMFSIRDVALAPRSQGCSVLTGHRMSFAIPSGLIGGYRLVKAAELRRAWDSGLMLPQKSMFKKFWTFLNPVGLFRVGIRDYLGKTSSISIGGIKGLLSKVPLPLDQMFHHIAKTADLSRLSPEERSRLESLSDASLRNLLVRWQELLADSTLRETLSESAILTALSARAKPRNYDIALRGLIVVGNIHHIITNVTVGSARFLAINSDEPPSTTKVRASGLIVVYTIDNVETDLQVHAESLMNRALETAALSQALEDLRATAP